jgi:type II secretory pathway pseudopilin PulG
MIKLFRQSRQKLIMENNTSNYIKYAIGEVVLVVIGILLAIQLNQWRMESNNNNQKKTVLNALQLEFESNLKQLEKVIYYIEEVPKAYLIANKMINNNAIKYSAKDYEELIMGLGWVYTFNPSNGALRSAISITSVSFDGGGDLTSCLGVKIISSSKSSSTPFSFTYITSFTSSIYVFVE